MATREQLVAQLQDWCPRAETSEIKSLASASRLRRDCSRSQRWQHARSRTVVRSIGVRRPTQDDSTPGSSGIRTSVRRDL
jgi:hypothetical protein